MAAGTARTELQAAEQPAAAIEGLGLDYHVETPENVILAFQIAGPAVRLRAYAVDFIVRVSLFSAVSNFLLTPLAYASQGISTGLLLVALFVIDWLYFGLSEWLFRGKTIGKHLFGLRVIHEGGYPVSLWGAVLRNFVRAADSLPILGIVPLYGAGLVTMVASGRFRRLGDLAARTIVIEERRVSIPREPVILEKIEPLPRTELGGFVPAPQTLALIEEYLGRRHVLSYRRGHELAVQLARVLSARLRYGDAGQQAERYPMAFLARVFATFHQTREDDDADPRQKNSRADNSIAAATRTDVSGGRSP
jgi:uncharacterized RDD family membrane protein YckC